MDGNLTWNEDKFDISKLNVLLDHLNKDETRKDALQCLGDLAMKGGYIFIRYFVNRKKELIKIKQMKIEVYYIKKK